MLVKLKLTQRGFEDTVGHETVFSPREIKIEILISYKESNVGDQLKKVEA